MTASSGDAAAWCGKQADAGAGEDDDAEVLKYGPEIDERRNLVEVKLSSKTFRDGEQRFPVCGGMSTYE